MSQRLGGVASDIESGAGASLLAVRTGGWHAVPHTLRPEDRAPWSQ